MDSVDLEVMKSCSRWLADGRRVYLATVVKTWGSAPRPEGAMMCIREDGLVVGSVSGGCIEDDLIDQVRRCALTSDMPSVARYGITADEAHRFGLPCGGTLELVIEPLTAASGIDELVSHVEAGELVTRTVDLLTGCVRLSRSTRTDGLQYHRERQLATVHGPGYRMLLIGAGQLSRYMASIGVGLGYEVTVCDPRTEYSEGWDMAGTRVVYTMPDDTVLDMRLDERCAVVAVTHDPKLDDLALMEALRTPAFYVGALGSRRNNAARRERLREFDLDESQLGRLRGPAGIYIGSRTPPEIALSILAEITAAKNQVSLPDSVRVHEAKLAREIERECQVLPDTAARCVSKLSNATSC
ncbi:XdhC family protein [Paraburkholderia terrae]|uniref:XdhC family protein n=1 Tax=Paraburkholderia TaxID=1822464 RepID=UPI001EE26281|nr:XdhC family protein [Paraburkholderia terrae]BEU21192.1 XdhC family protein [Paraburkholderia sp. 22B1P]GJH06755.1 XdhC family protein [Paraburkholderia terrae]